MFSVKFSLWSNFRDKKFTIIILLQVYNIGCNNMMGWKFSHFLGPLSISVVEEVSVGNGLWSSPGIIGTGPCSNPDTSPALVGMGMGPHHSNYIPGSSSADVSGLIEASLPSDVVCGALSIGWGIPSSFFLRKTRCIVSFFPVLQMYFNLFPRDKWSPEIFTEIHVYWNQYLYRVETSWLFLAHPRIDPWTHSCPLVT